MNKGDVAVKIYRAFKDAGKTWHLDDGTPPEFSQLESEIAYMAQELANQELTQMTENPNAINAGAWLAVEIAGWTLGSTLSEDTSVVATHAAKLGVALGQYERLPSKGAMRDKWEADVRLAALALTELENAHTREHGNSDIWDHARQWSIKPEDVYYQIIRRLLSKADRRPASIPAWRQFISQVIRNGK